MNAVELIGFHSKYGSNKILQKINLSFSSHAITAIIGPSGCGKTTLLRSINRTAEMEPNYKSQGDIRVLGQSIFSIKDLSQVRRQVGLVYQTPIALPFSIKENVLFAPKYYGEKKPTNLDYILKDSLKKVALWDEVKDRLNKPASQLSGGQKQRLAIARTLAVKPQVLLLDEPCSSLDPASTSLIEELILNLASELSIIIVTHNLFQARRIADETVFILDGKVIEQAPTEQLFTQAKSQKTKGFIAGLFG